MAGTARIALASVELTARRITVMLHAKNGASRETRTPVMPGCRPGAIAARRSTHESGGMYGLRSRDLPVDNRLL